MISPAVALAFWFTLTTITVLLHYSRSQQVAVCDTCVGSQCTAAV